MDKSKAKSIFFPEGKVFAPKFQFDREGYNISPNSFIEFSVRTSLKNASFKGDEYIMDYAEKISPKSFTPIITIKYQTSLESGFITQDELASCIDKVELKKLNGNFFLRSGNYLYGLFKYDGSYDIIRPVKGKETNKYEIDASIYQNNCVKINQNEYFIGNLKHFPFKQVGIIDCMDDRQIGEWCKEQLKSCAEAEKFLSIKKDVFQNFASKFKETNDFIDEIRLERAKGKLDSLEFTFKEIKELLDLDSSLTQVLNDTLKQMKDEYESSWTATLEDSKTVLNNEIEKLTQQKDKLKADIETIQAKYSVEEKSLESSFQEKKTKIDAQIKELELKRDGVKTQIPRTMTTSFDYIEIEPIEFEKIRPKFFGLIKVTPEDGIKANQKIGKFVKNLKV